MNPLTHFVFNSHVIIIETYYDTFYTKMFNEQCVAVVPLLLMTLITNVLEDGESVFLDLMEECPIGLNEILTTCSH